MKGGESEPSTKMNKISSDDIFGLEKQKRTQNRIWHKIASMLIFALLFAIKNDLAMFSPWEEALISCFISKGD